MFPLISDKTRTIKEKDKKTEFSVIVLNIWTMPRSSNFFIKLCDKQVGDCDGMIDVCTRNLIIIEVNSANQTSTYHLVKNLR